MLFSCFSHSLLGCCSDEACTSGQLVIASRESQYKILHFHHAGLDKLAEVFQQWKCCRETQLKDQVGLQSKILFGFQFYWETKEVFSLSFLVLYSDFGSVPTIFCTVVFFSFFSPKSIAPLSFRCQMKNLACSFPSRGPPYRQQRLTQRRGFIGGQMSPRGYVISTTPGRQRRNINFARYICGFVHAYLCMCVCKHVHVFTRLCT